MADPEKPKHYRLKAETGHFKIGFSDTVEADVIKAKDRKPDSEKAKTDKPTASDAGHTPPEKP